MNQSLTIIIFREVHRGGHDLQPGENPYPLMRHYAKSVNRSQHISTFTTQELKDLAMFDHQKLYELRDEYIIPWLQGKGNRGR